MAERQTSEDIMYLIAKRAKELANLRMPVLKQAASYEGLDLGDGSRGSIIEAVLCEEFLESCKTLDSFVKEADDALANHDWN